ncbi:MAG: RNA polymerase sigma factor [Bacteroidia bacterium]
MRKAVFQKLKARLQKGELLVFRQLLNKHGAATMAKLMDHTGCSQSTAEQVWLDAVLLFRNRIVGGKVQELHDLGTYLYQVCMDVYRQDHIGKSTSDPIALKNFYYDQARRRFDRDIQEEIVRTPATYYSEVVDATRLSMYQLDDEGKQILQLFYFYKQDFRQIAEAMGMTEDEVRRRKTQYYGELMSAVAARMAYSLQED